MDFDVELEVSEANKPAAEALAQAVQTATLITRSKVASVYLRTDDSEQKNSNLEIALTAFLLAFAPCRLSVRELGATLRVGAFFQTKDYAFVPVILSRTLLDILDDLRLSLSISYYPCSDEVGADGA
ncbi:hypothetical protein C7H84_34035 [Burkholderia sp. Nafp2/4-1b]|uniref:hypothetical protein n=1 Tax=Burkholderia sp. Nafp2/4-1b TaxID=2116686 RepID=UPI000F1FE570|nr:hypothetical protein [Burkholderia sp. Nafp2/4-1b]RKT98977.1 hypothetical protein C7H84_34035 [Burkholderia sp. Nafp2/4-1b]